MTQKYRVTITADTPDGQCADGVWIVDANSYIDADKKGKEAAIRAGWRPIRVRWTETVEEHARFAAEIREGIREGLGPAETNRAYRH